MAVYEDCDTVSETEGLTYVKGLRKKYLPPTKYCLIVAMILNFVIMVMGAKYVRSCPISIHIPIFLIISGLIGLCSTALTFSKGRFLQDRPLVTKIEACLHLTGFVCFVIGSFWVYRILHLKSYHESKQTLYCNRTLYVFALTYVTTIYAISGFFIVLSLCCCGCYALLTLYEQSDPIPKS